MSKEKQRCCARTYQDNQSWPCSRKGSVERDGKWYCKQHDPVAVKERDAARRAKWDAEREERYRVQKLKESTRATELEVIELARKVLISALAEDSWEDLKEEMERDPSLMLHEEDAALYHAIAKLDALKAEAGEPTP